MLKSLTKFCLFSTLATSSIISHSQLFRTTVDTTCKLNENISLFKGKTNLSAHQIKELDLEDIKNIQLCASPSSDLSTEENCFKLTLVSRSSLTKHVVFFTKEDNSLEYLQALPYCTKNLKFTTLNGADLFLYDETIKKAYRFIELLRYNHQLHTNSILDRMSSGSDSIQLIGLATAPSNQDQLTSELEQFTKNNKGRILATYHHPTKSIYIITTDTRGKRQLYRYVMSSS